MTHISAEAEAALNAARRPNGRFGNQEHAVGDVALDMPATEPSYGERLTKLALKQRSAGVSLCREANRALLSNAAARLEETHPHIMSFTVGEGPGITVTQAWDSNSDLLPAEDCDAIASALSAARVEYEPDFHYYGVHLHPMREWEPNASVPSTKRALNRAERALAAGTSGAHSSEAQQMAHLLTDLRHMAAERGISFEDVLTESASHFESEQAEDLLAADD